MSTENEELLGAVGKTYTLNGLLYGKIKMLFS